MPFPIEQKLVVAVSSSAVFDMNAADTIFRDEGIEAYRKYQLEHLDKPFDKGVAFPFISRLLRLNLANSKEKPIEVVVLSRNDPDSGRRFYKSCAHHHLAISRGAFTNGKSPYEYMPSFNACLFLSANDVDVKNAIKNGFPAGLVLPTEAIDEEWDDELRVAFDFDGVIIDDEAEKVYQQTQDVLKFHESESMKSELPHQPGPLSTLIKKMSKIQQWERLEMRKDKNYVPKLRIAIVTARDAPANERMVTTLNNWGLEAVEAFFLGGIEKKRILDVLKPHIFFEDQLSHLATAAASVPSVHIPFGITNVSPAETP